MRCHDRLLHSQGRTLVLCARFTAYRFADSILGHAARVMAAKIPAVLLHSYEYPEVKIIAHHANATLPEIPNAFTVLLER